MHSRYKVLSFLQLALVSTVHYDAEEINDVDLKRGSKYLIIGWAKVAGVMNSL